jgi:hypothetical protein
LTCVIIRPWKKERDFQNNRKGVFVMTKKEKLEQLENARFMLQMQDHWSHEDFEYDSKLAREIAELEKEVK